MCPPPSCASQIIKKHTKKNCNHIEQILFIDWRSTCGDQAGQIAVVSTVSSIQFLLLWIRTLPCIETDLTLQLTFYKHSFSCFCLSNILVSKVKQVQLGVPHSEIQVELNWELIRCLRISWGDTAHSWDIWSDVKTRVGTPQKILRRFRIRGGTPHIPFEGIWWDIQTKVGTPHWVGGCFL